MEEVGDFISKDKKIAQYLEKMRGSSVLGEGLEFQNVRSEMIFENGVKTLRINAQIKNTGSNSRPVPWVRATLYDAKNDEVQFK